MADKQGLGIVLSQLLDNALKFSQDRVELSARRVGQSVVVSVHDYGIGIPEDKAEQIFDSFYQVDATSTRRFGGTGVGLAIVRLILDRHHTQIHVESEEGRGSTFTFQLPIVSTGRLRE
jgi:signal transduction histidine kinase